mmetsp:Transcript_48638/g.128656  ORF Transcript_48638/g.128656 Transcript_48638/m.128656 type:complete len:342 (+) Transcript_48638:504-1529(+)
MARSCSNLATQASRCAASGVAEGIGVSSGPPWGSVAAGVARSNFRHLHAMKNRIARTALSAVCAHSTARRTICLPTCRAPLQRLSSSCTATPLRQRSRAMARRAWLAARCVASAQRRARLRCRPPTRLRSRDRQASRVAASCLDAAACSAWRYLTRAHALNQTPRQARRSEQRNTGSTESARSRRHCLRVFAHSSTSRSRCCSRANRSRPRCTALHHSRTMIRAAACPVRVTSLSHAALQWPLALNKQPRDLPCRSGNPESRHAAQVSRSTRSSRAPCALFTKLPSRRRRCCWSTTTSRHRTCNSSSRSVRSSSSSAAATATSLTKLRTSPRSLKQSSLHA